MPFIKQLKTVYSIHYIAQGIINSTNSQDTVKGNIFLYYINDNDMKNADQIEAKSINRVQPGQFFQKFLNI